MLFLCGSALIFVSLLVLNLLTGAGAYIKHERDLYHSVQYVCIGYYTPASAISGYCTSGGVIWYLSHKEAILCTRCSAARGRSIELAS